MVSPLKRSIVSAFALLAFAGLALAGEPAKVAPSGKSLVVPEAQAKLGTVYYTIPEGIGNKSGFQSKALNEEIKGHSNQMIGYAVAGPSENPAKLAAGEWHLPVASLRTGNSTRDQHLTEEGWLNAGKFPHIVFQLKEVKDIKETSNKDKPGSIRAFSATLVGDMTIHGVTKEITISNATMNFQKQTDMTAQVIGQGDIMTLGAKWKLALADYGVANDTISVKKKVAEEIELSVSLGMMTVPPEKQEGTSIKPADLKIDPAKAPAKAPVKDLPKPDVKPSKPVSDPAPKP